MGSADSHHDCRGSTLPTPPTQSKTKPRTRQPPPAATTALRRHLADSPDRETADHVPSVARHRGAAMKARTFVVVLLAVLLVTAVGCGGEGGKKASGASLTFW